MAAGEQVATAVNGVHTTDWATEGSAGRPVRWWDLDEDADPAAVHALLSAHCGSQLTEEMVRELLTPDTQAKFGRSSELRTLGAFCVRTENTLRGAGGDSHAGVLHFQNVEFLTGPDWVATCWHHPEAYRGAQKLAGAASSPLTHARVHDAVSRRWAATGARTAGDLGVLILHELALTFAPARRDLEHWLEVWELELYQRDGVQRSTLEDIWGAVARFRDWLDPLNLPGMKTDPERAWFSGITLREEIREIDNRLDRTLEALSGLARVLRASFRLVHDEEQKRRTNRLELLAMVALVPTFIASFWGANTAVPGGGQWWGFDTMVIAMVLSTLVAVAWVRRLQRSPAKRPTPRLPKLTDNQTRGGADVSPLPRLRDSRRVLSSDPPVGLFGFWPYPVLTSTPRTMHTGLRGGTPAPDQQAHHLLA